MEAGDHSGSIYLKNPTAHGSGSSSVNFWTLVTSSAEFVVQMRVRPGNALSIRTTGSVEVRTGTAGEVPVGSWMRLDWKQSGTTFSWRLFTSDPEGTTPDLSGTLTTTATGQPNGLYLGADSSATIPKDWQFDTVRADSTGAWFGPYNTAPPPPTGPTYTVWNGTSEVAVQSVTIWNGTSEVPVASSSIA